MDAVVWVLVAVFLVVGMAVTVHRMRRGGPGPQVGWVPKRLRPMTDRWYERHGWQTPYDDDGSFRTDRSRT